MHFPRDGDIGPFYLDQQGFQSVSQVRNEWKLGKSIRHLDTCPVYEAISKVWLRCGSSWGGEVLTVFLKTTTYLKKPWLYQYNLISIWRKKNLWGSKSAQVSCEVALPVSRRRRRDGSLISQFKQREEGKEGERGEAKFNAEKMGPVTAASTKALLATPY